ncbi:transposase, partial [Streptomyces hirsutus]
FNGEQGHVHPLVHHPPTVQLSKPVDSLKGVSSRRLRLGAPPDRRPGKSTPRMSAGTCGRTLPVRLLLRRIMRRDTPDRRQAAHRKPAAPRPTVTPETKNTPAPRASGPRTAFTPALKGGALAKTRGRPRRRTRCRLPIDGPCSPI